MPLITSIKQQKNKNRVNVYLDNKFGFGIDLDNFVLSNLKVGKNISEKELDDILKKGEFQKNFDKALRFMTIRPRSENELEGYLSRKKVPSTIKKEIFSRLKSLDLLDDKKFASWWIEVRQEFSPRSKRILTNELLLKGVNREIIESALNKVDINEEKIAVNLIKKRESHWKRMEKEKLRQKILSYLLGKGFSWSVAQKAFKEYNIIKDGKVN